jgi:membrane-bound lytic murein transglycosylase MltF
MPPDAWNTLPKMPNGAMGTMKISPYTSRSVKLSDRFSSWR